MRNGIGRSRERILREEREALVWIGKMVRRRRRRWKEKDRREMPSANIGAFEREAGGSGSEIGLISDGIISVI